jgi:uncharacterized membrane protein (UPF0127 family)
MAWRLFLFLPALALFLCGCSPDDLPAEDPATINTWLPLEVGDVTIEVQLAITQNEMSKGLMHRDYLPPDGGMLFAYKRPQQGSFWMANTPLPLDIGFFNSQGVLLEVHRMVSYDTNKTRSGSDEVQYALEMNRGWYSGNGVFPGARLNLEDVAKALAERGEDPRMFALPVPD